MAQTDILTGQYVRIEQTAASVGDRIFAQLLDWGIMVVYIIIVFYLIVQFGLGNFWIYEVFLSLVIVFYSPMMEIFNHGQTFGKMAMKLRVVKVDGASPSLGAFLLRWLFFLVDGPATSFLGLIPMLVTKNSQRLGDMVAGTMVIKLQSYTKIQASLDDYDYLEKNYTPRYVQAADLSLEQIEIIRRTIASSRADNDQLVAQLSTKVQQKLGIAAAETTDVAFLNRIVRDYQYYALALI